MKGGRPAAGLGRFELPVDAQPVITLQSLGIKRDWAASMKRYVLWRLSFTGIPLSLALRQHAARDTSMKGRFRPHPES
jgi:hypothetical protein